MGSLSSIILQAIEIANAKKQREEMIKEQERIANMELLGIPLSFAGKVAGSYFNDLISSNQNPLKDKMGGV